MKKKIKNIMKYSNERFNKEGPRKFRKNNQRKSKVIIPKEAYAHLKSHYKKILWILFFTYEIFYVVSEIFIFIFDIWKPVSDFEIFFDCDEEIWTIVWILS